MRRAVALPPACAAACSGGGGGAAAAGWLAGGPLRGAPCRMPIPRPAPAPAPPHPRPRDAIAATAEATNPMATYIRGRLIDRVAADGSLAAVRQPMGDSQAKASGGAAGAAAARRRRRLSDSTRVCAHSTAQHAPRTAHLCRSPRSFDQFPLTCDVSAKLYKGWATKIVAYRVSRAGAGAQRSHGSGAWRRGWAHAAGRAARHPHRCAAPLRRRLTSARAAARSGSSSPTTRRRTMGRACASRAVPAPPRLQPGPRPVQHHALPPLQAQLPLQGCAGGPGGRGCGSTWVLAAAPPSPAAGPRPTRRARPPARRLAGGEASAWHRPVAEHRVRHGD